MNTFGSSSQQFALTDPRGAHIDRQRFRREAIPALEQVNSFYCPAGRWSFRGWVLLDRTSYNKLDTYSTALQLNIGDPTKPDNTATLKNLAIVQAQCVTRGLSSDKNALYLVELTDGRGVLHNRWFQFPATTSYNVRAPAYPQTDRGGTYYTGSMNGGTTWTWSTLLSDLWSSMGTFLGAYPGLPTNMAVPLNAPENFYLQGVPAWPALCDILDHLGMTVACDLTQASPYTLVSMGAADSAFAALQTKYAARLEDDLEWIDTGAGRVPQSIKVLFRRRNDVYGTEEVVRRDGQQWVTTPLYSVSVAAPSRFASATGTHHLWDDFTVRYDMDGVINSTDAAYAAQIAQDRVNQYFALIYSQTDGYLTQTYGGALPFKTGSQVDGVRWWYFDDGSRHGWRTQVVRGSDPPWPELWEHHVRPPEVAR